MARGQQVLLYIAALATLSCGAALHARSIDTASGLVQGVEMDAVTVYRGIPFAEPPVGPLRWREPQPPAPWTGIRQADSFPPACPQHGSYPEDAPPEASSEDCLYLNIWKPSGTSEQALPVMLWIHGGSLRNGSASIPLYAGDKLARHGVILVTANYRLGPLGFLAHPELTRESGQQSSGNYGLMDQLAALTWIQQNIAAFGGDPDRVTVFGHSSGAISISALSSSPLAKGLFHRAIGQSGGLFEPMEFANHLSLEGAEQAGLRFMGRANAASLEELRTRPASELIDVPFRADIIVDGHVLPATPYETHRRDEHIPVPVLVGYTAEEGQEFIADRSITVENFRDELQRHFPGFLVRLAAPDPGSTDQEARRAALAFQRDVRFAWSMWTWARLASRDAEARAYLYYFSQPTPYPANSLQAGWGAAHGSELAYVFGHLDQYPWAWTVEDRKLSAMLLNYWTNFARTGDPNGPGLPEWPAFSAAKPVAMHFGETVAPAPFQTTGTLDNLDRTYAAARWIHRNLYLLSAIAVLLTLTVLAALVVFVRRRWRGRLKVLT